MMKQSEVAALPAYPMPTAHAESDVKPPAQTNTSPVESASSGAGNPDLLAPSVESMPTQRGSAMRKAIFDLLGERVEQSSVPAESENDAMIEERPKRRTKVRTLPWWQSWEREREAIHEHDLAILASEPGAPSLSLMVPDNAPMADGGLLDKVGIDPKDKSRRTSMVQQGTGLCDSDVPQESGDRLHRVAVVAHTVTHDLRPPKSARPGSLPALRPKSKAECERRCGSDGFCDPSNLLGCGGLHCGQQRDMLY